MKQILQNLSNGDTQVVEVPCPQVTSGRLLIQTSRSLISAGTERMLVEFGKANFIDKARQQPDKVRMVLDKTRTDGLLPTLTAVRDKLDRPSLPGYCNAGSVIGIGDGVRGFAVGDRVACNGAHAEVVSVPANLCAKVPDDVPDEAAAFTVLGAVALHGVRLAQPTLGEAFVVTGLGLVGLLTVQVLRAQGCRVLGIDTDAKKLVLARRLGAETVDLSNGQDPLAVGRRFSRGRGVDGVLITASTKSNEPIRQGAKMCRKRGRIILIGVTGLDLSRADFYENELTFQVSCSYGPGRYDQDYEEKGQDYPIGFVRWTEQRNFEAVLDLLADGSLDIAPLISHRIAFDESARAYALLAGDTPSLGIMLEYPPTPELARHAPNVQSVAIGAAAPPGDGPVVGFIGAGNYAGRVLMPAFRAAGAKLHSVASNGGVNSVHYGKKHGFAHATTDTAGLLADQRIDTVVVATRHDSHARLVCDALGHGKNVFVEKPLARTLDELADIEAAYRGNLETSARLMVGFNRRFAPQVRKMTDLLAETGEPKTLVMTVNAGAVPSDHWTQDAIEGGGRMIGEGCHFIDLLRFLAGAPVIGFQVTAMGSMPNTVDTCDNFSVTLRFTDGSVGTLHYFANGHGSFPKERLEVFCVGRVLQLDNFRRLTGYGWSNFKKMHLWRQDKGQRACAKAFVDAVKEGTVSPIDFHELMEVSRVSIEIAQSLKSSC